MDIVVLDGLPGTGKSYVARKVLQNIFGYHHYDADIDLPASEIQSIKNGLIPTHAMRLDHITCITSTIRKLQITHKKLAITHAFMQNRYRKVLWEQIPQATFILVECAPLIRQRRLLSRQNHVIQESFAYKLDGDYEYPTIPHVIINNDFDGTEKIIEQIHSLVSR